MIINLVIANDIYFDIRYGELYESLDQGVCTEYIYKNSVGIIKYIFIKRPIRIAGLNSQYYDIITPYGYGGPLIMDCKDDERNILVKKFDNEFNDYCNKNNIVSEFVRFHPIYDNAKDFRHIYDIVPIRKTIATEITDEKDNYENQFSKSARKTIRRCIREGITYELNINPSNLDLFKEIYYSTMDRNHSSDFYYFDDNYFNRFIQNFGENILNINIIFENKIIASSLNFFSKNILNVHLSGTRAEYLYLSPAYLLKYAAYEWGKKNNIRFIHYGGGTSNSSEDSLLQFKKKFGKKEFEFKIAKRIRNISIYNKLTNITETSSSTFFPAYRDTMIN